MLTLVNESVQEDGDIESHEDEFKDISNQIEMLNKRINAIRESECANGELQTRLREIQEIIDERKENQDIYISHLCHRLIV